MSDFELWFTIATLLATVCYTLTKLAYLDRYSVGKLASINNYIASLFPSILVLFIIRSFIVEPFRIPSASQAPTLIIGDFVLVNKFIYGLRLPILGIPLIKFQSPQRGDIIVFRFPPNPSIYFTKRLIGLPGDQIQYRNKTLTINGRIIRQEELALTHDTNEKGQPRPVLLTQEYLGNDAHKIYKNVTNQAEHNVHANAKNNFSVTVPEGHYFVLGDNRDNSLDSRYWGFVPETYVIGPIKWVVMSWNSLAAWKHPVQWIRWDRVGIQPA